MPTYYQRMYAHVYTYKCTYATKHCVYNFCKTFHLSCFYHNKPTTMYVCMHVCIYYIHTSCFSFPPPPTLMIFFYAAKWNQALRHWRLIPRLAPYLQIAALSSNCRHASFAHLLNLFSLTPRRTMKSSAFRLSEQTTCALTCSDFRPRPASRKYVSILAHVRIHVYTHMCAYMRTLMCAYMHVQIFGIGLRHENMQVYWRMYVYTHMCAHINVWH